MKLKHSESGVIDLVIISGRLIGLNEYISAERTNLYKAASIKRQLENDTIAAAIIAADKGTLHSHTGLCKLEVNFVEPNHRRDLDNISFCMKGIQDALVKCGVFPDDSTKFIDELHYTVSFDSNRPRVEVQIIEKEKK